MRIRRITNPGERFARISWIGRHPNGASIRKRCRSRRRAKARQTRRNGPCDTRRPSGNGKCTERPPTIESRQRACRASRPVIQATEWGGDGRRQRSAEVGRGRQRKSSATTVSKTRRNGLRRFRPTGAHEGSPTRIATRRTDASLSTSIGQHCRRTREVLQSPRSPIGGGHPMRATRAEFDASIEVAIAWG